MAISKEGDEFHWQQGPVVSKCYPITWEPKQKIHIGALVTVNERCSVNEERRWLDSGESLDNLGTYGASWQSPQKQAGIQGGQYVIAQYSHTWVKVPCTTLKQAHIDLLGDRLLLPFLESNWGLQVSLCTRIARRVALRKLIADVMPAFVESCLPVPPLWQSSKDHNVIDAFSSGDLRAWMSQLAKDFQDLVIQIVNYILSVLQYTGVDKQGEHIVIAWIQKNRPFQCFKITCENECNWALMLTDSEDCATFAYVTSTCLETDNIKCHGSATRWHNTSTLLETAVCRHMTGEVDSTPTLSTHWTLKHLESYSIGSSPQLWAKVERVQRNDIPRLYMFRSTMPTGLLSRLHLKRLAAKRIREKPAFDARAEEVVVLAGKPGT